MSDFQIILDESLDMVFELDIQGASTNNLKTRLLIETGDGFNLTFDGDMDVKGSATTFHIPILAQTLVPDTYKCSVEAIIEDGHYVKMAEATLEARLPVKIKASYTNNQLAPEKDFSDVKATVKFNKPEEPVVEEKQDDEEASLAAELQAKAEREEMDKSINAFAEEIKDTEGRDFEVKDLNMSLKTEDEEGTFVGYGAVFGNIDQAGDIIQKGAFKRTLNSGRKVKMFWQHDKREPIGVFDEMYEDDHGLVVKGRIAIDVQRGKDAYTLLKMEALDGLSIGYSVTNSTNDRKTGVRHLTELKLHEVSVVSMPCNEEATIVAIKSNEETINKDITSSEDNSVKAHSDEDSGATHSSDDSSNHLNSDVDTETKALNESLEKLLTTYNKNKKVNTNGN